MKFTVLTVAGTLLLTGAVAAYAHGGASGVVKERMDAMGAMGDTMKFLSAMMRGEKEYDAELVRKGAAVIQSHSGEALTKLFPEHSAEDPSEAKHEIWTEWQDFSDLANQLEVFAIGLGEAAGNGLAHSGDGNGMMGQDTIMGGNSMMSQGGMMGSTPMMGDAGHMADPALIAQMPADGVFNMVAQTCSACHSKFRVEKK
ncbi:c-type cytochrome [Roseibium aggregatum]|jgi:cytochrome c556|uniref:Cytochrome c n=1 Tax=Roseibium aggregatum TaxID=187304 RepID=A0A0M6YC07_9HYPH|nr:cytochrome c [Roseibium aggregatum]MEC9471559.1 cytochrome c [Pseudomonadota bacterium]CTQ47626.1 Cytochrome c' precursor [Roseibium aggregatum]